MMDGAPPNFLIVGKTPGVWTAFSEWFVARGEAPPPEATDGVFIMEPGRLLAGCCIFPCDGPYAVVEFAATNPRAPKRRAHDAMLYGARVLSIYGATRSKVMLCFPRSRGMAKLLERAGFAYEKTPVMTPRMP